MTVEELRLTGSDPEAFTLHAPADLPIALSAGAAFTALVEFTPQEAAPSGNEFLEAALEVTTARGVTLVTLAGINGPGMEGDFEPPLQRVVSALGFELDVGGEALHLGMEADPIGHEVPRSLFQKADSGRPVEITPVARYSPPGPVPFGIYTVRDGEVRRTVVATLSDGPLQHQTLHPQIVDGDLSFDPGEDPFGLFVEAERSVRYTQRALNADTVYAARVYPLSASRYLVAFEEAQNGDYQDYVFVISNVRAVEP